MTIAPADLPPIELVTSPPPGEMEAVDALLEGKDHPLLAGAARALVVVGGRHLSPAPRG